MDYISDIKTSTQSEDLYNTTLTDDKETPRSEFYCLCECVNANRYVSIPNNILDDNDESTLDWMEFQRGDRYLSVMFDITVFNRILSDKKDLLPISSLYIGYYNDNIHKFLHNNNHKRILSKVPQTTFSNEIEYNVDNFISRGMNIGVSPDSRKIINRGNYARILLSSIDIAVENCKIIIDVLSKICLNDLSKPNNSAKKDMLTSAIVKLNQIRNSLRLNTDFYGAKLTSDQKQYQIYARNLINSLNKSWVSDDVDISNIDVKEDIDTIYSASHRYLEIVDPIIGELHTWISLSTAENEKIKSRKKIELLAEKWKIKIPKNTNGQDTESQLSWLEQEDLYRLICSLIVENPELDRYIYRIKSVSVDEALKTIAKNNTPIPELLMIELNQICYREKSYVRLITIDNLVATYVCLASWDIRQRLVHKDKSIGSTLILYHLHTIKPFNNILDALKYQGSEWLDIYRGN